MFPIPPETECFIPTEIEKYIPFWQYQIITGFDNYLYNIYTQEQGYIKGANTEALVKNKNNNNTTQAH